MNKLIKISKKGKAQQEMVGFVIIILLVVVAGVIFLGIWLRGDSNNKNLKESAEMSYFLSSSLRFTTECYRAQESGFRNLEDLLGDCYNGRQCDNALNACEIANKTFFELLGAAKDSNSFQAENLKLEFFYTQNLSDLSSRIPINGLSTLEIGNKTGCNSWKASQNSISLSGGVMVVAFELCKKS
jgi:hypothetical protein